MASVVMTSGSHSVARPLMKFQAFFFCLCLPNGGITGTCSWDLDQEHFIYKSGDYYIGYLGLKWAGATRKLCLELILPATHRVGRNRDS